MIYCEANSERQYYKAICDQVGVDVTIVSSTKQCKEELAISDHHLILLSLHLVDIHSFELTKYIRKQPSYTHTPVVVMTANDRADVLQDALDAKISDVCEKRHVHNLKSIIERMNSRHKKIEARVLYVEDDKAVAAVTIQTLEMAGMKVDWCTGVKDAQTMALEKQYDLLLLDTILNNSESGVDFLVWLRANASEQNQNIPALIVSSFNAADRKIQVFNAGADDFLSKPYIEDELLARVIGLIERKQFELGNTSEQNSALEQKRTRFLATITHDLRAPLNAVLGNLQLLETSDLEATQKKNVTQAIQSAGLLNDLIQDLLEFSIIEDDQFTLYPKPHDLVALCNEVFNTINVASHNQYVKFNLFIEPSLPKQVNLDALRLKQVLLNLLSNASKFTKRGHIDFNIEYNGQNQEAVFHVRDTGKGIDEKDLNTIFDIFSQSDKESDDAKKGCGLGLSICNRLVGLFGGKLHVESQINKGSHFYFTMPLTLNEQPFEVPAPLAIPFDDNDYCVLVVDDNQFNLDVMGGFLKKLNIQYECASNGQQGLKLLEQHAYNAVILDCQMPIMDGYTMAQEMRYDHRLNHISIIASSGNFDETEKRKCLDSGVDDFLPKPVKFPEMKAVLEQAFVRTSLCAENR